MPDMGTGEILVGEETNGLKGDELYYARITHL